MSNATAFASYEASYTLETAGTVQDDIFTEAINQAKRNTYTSALEHLVNEPFVSDETALYLVYNDPVQQSATFTIEGSAEAVIRVISSMLEALSAVSNNDVPWTDKELDAMLDFKVAAGAEVIAQGLTGLWKDRGIADSVQWVEEVRSKEHR